MHSGKKRDRGYDLVQSKNATIHEEHRLKQLQEEIEAQSEALPNQLFKRLRSRFGDNDLVSKPEVLIEELLQLSS